MIQMALSEAEWDLAMARMEAFPEHLKMAILGLGVLTKEQMLLHIDKRDEIGERIARIQLDYMKKLKVV